MIRPRGNDSGKGVAGMDGQRFDSVTRLIGAGASRRRVLKVLLGGVVAGAAAVRGRGEASAGCVEVVGTSCATNCCGAGLVCVDSTGTECEVFGGNIDCTCQIPSICAREGDPCSLEVFAPGVRALTVALDCCEGLVCEFDGKGSSCQVAEPTCAGEGEDCTEIDCCDGLECLTGGGVTICNAILVCAGEGEGCGILDGIDEIECCNGFACNSEGICEPMAPVAECEDDGDCDAGEICCAEACRAIECCVDDVLTGGNPNDRCDEGAVCFEGQCVFVCKGDSDCAGETCCCGDGSCYAECCEDVDYTPPATTGGVTTLPSTGIGDGGSNLTGLLGLGLAAGAAAYLAGKTVTEREGS